MSACVVTLSTIYDRVVCTRRRRALLLMMMVRRSCPMVRARVSREQDKSCHRSDGVDCRRRTLAPPATGRPRGWGWKAARYWVAVVGGESARPSWTDSGITGVARTDRAFAAMPAFFCVVKWEETATSGKNWLVLWELFYWRVELYRNLRSI